jgi:hypothetical protein
MAKKPVDVTPQNAKRAYELYEKRGRQDGRAVQDWEQAEHEIRKDQVGRESLRLLWRARTWRKPPPNDETKKLNEN